MAEAPPTISVVIRTLNEEDRLGALLECLRSQRAVGKGPEIIVVDSGSTDRTLDIVRSHEVMLVQIAPEEFNYSTALNLGIEKSRGDLILILSGHSVPTSENWISQMGQHFADPNVAGVYCRQKAWDDASHHERRRIMAAFGEYSTVYICLNHEEIPFSNAASCIRRSFWEEHNFLVLPAAEDQEWAQWALTRGYKIVYDAQAAVYHSHNECARKSAKRLIEIEKNTDIQICRHRNRLFTIGQGLKCYGELASTDLAEHTGVIGKIRMLVEDAKYIFWYIIDFKD